MLTARTGASALLLAIILGRAYPLLAHAELIRANPAVDSVVDAAPTSVRLWFSEPVDVTGDAVIVIDPRGARVDGADAHAAADDATAVDVSVRAEATGSYTVRWRAISADSHPIAGTIGFAVGAATNPAGVPRGGATAQRPAVLFWQALVRWAHLCGLVLMCGPILMWVLLDRRVSRDRVAASLWRLVTIGAVVLVLAAATGLLVQAVDLSGSVDRGLTGQTLGDLLGTSWGRLWSMRALLALTALALAVGWRAPDGPRPVVSVPLGAALVATTAMNGHAATLSPVWLSLGIDGLHLLLSLVWVGGLVALGSVILVPANRPAESDADALSATVSRFSYLAGGCVLILAGTGLYQAWRHVGQLNLVLTTGYGRTLLLKLALAVAMLLPAAAHLLAVRRWRLDGRVVVTAGRLTGFRHSLLAETVCGVAVLATTGWLTSQPPALRVASAKALPMTEGGLALERDLGPTRVSLRLSPGQVGANRFEVDLPSTADRRAVTDLRLRVVPAPDMGLSPWTVLPERVTERSYRATVALAPPGRWRVFVSVTLAGQAPETAEFEFDVPEARRR